MAETLKWRARELGIIDNNTGEFVKVGELKTRRFYGLYIYEVLAMKNGFVTKIGKALGFMRKPRLTYKTKRKNCAKRNR